MQQAFKESYSEDFRKNPELKPPFRNKISLPLQP